MVDFVKFAIPKASFIKDNEQLDFKHEVSLKTGELSNYQIAKNDNLKFKYFDKTSLLLVSGSLHKYFNGGIQNYDDYTISNLRYTLEFLCIEFGINLKECQLQNIEFGVNLFVDFIVKKLLDNLLLHGTKPFDNGYKAYYKECKHSDYYLKAYDKGTQHERLERIFRYELKFKKMRDLNQLGIYTLSDLMNDDWIKPIQVLLIQKWNKLLLYDFTIELTSTNYIKLLEWSNTNYWNSLTRMQKLRAFDKYVDYVKNHSANIHNMIENSISNKWIQLADN
ncbi:MAG: hypothetical protein JXQ96_13670 [Cyclobacteriaceae bacterium]